MLPSTASEVIHFQRLKSFGARNDGASPQSTVVQIADNALYGVTLMGGSNNAGIIYRINPDGSHYAVLHHFGSPADDGRNPLCDLTVASDSLLYGTTQSGGTNGDGTIFKVGPGGGGYVVIRSFNNSVDGSYPNGLIEGSDGMLYGTTFAGPNAKCGSAFAINKDGTGYRQLHVFGPYFSFDGVSPTTPLMEGSDHVLYGTTPTFGGSDNVGTVFKVNRDGTGFQKLHAFWGDGPSSSLVEGSDHALYGTFGKIAGSMGGVFKLNKDGTGYQNLVELNHDEPFGALGKGRDGALYGTSFTGPVPFHSGKVFRVNEDGTGFQVLYGFSSSAGDGIGPHAQLFLGSDGAFYSTTVAGGLSGAGTLYRLSVTRTPVAVCTDVIVPAGSDCVANASIDHGSFDPDGDPITLVQSPPGPYPLGTNFVTLIVTDTNGDTNYCTASVVVLDTTPPDITCPSNITVEFATESGAAVNYTMTAVDNCDAKPVMASFPVSGSVFPIGVTEVDSVATDRSGNHSSCAFTVSVLGARGVKQRVLEDLVGWRSSVICDAAATEVCQDLDSAIVHLRASLSPAWWVDETHVQVRYGGLVFDEESATVRELCRVIRLAPVDMPDGLIEDCIGRLQRADGLLASVAVREAIAAGMQAQRIQQAQRFLAKGNAEAAVDPCGNSIIDYRQAWRHVIRPQLSPPVHLANGHQQLELFFEPGAPVVIQASTNLVDWVNIGTGTAALNGVLRFEDAEASTRTVRYYRALSH